MLSDFKYRGVDGVEKVVPVVYGDLSRQVAAILKSNSENALPSAPRIAVYITDLEIDRERTGDSSFTSKIRMRERDVNEETHHYTTTQGLNYTVERLMPTPYKLTFKADVWATNTEQKLQILEQILVLFNPSFEIQTTDNFVDWTSLSVVELTDVVFSNRSIPVGTESEIDVATMEFQTPIWITPPAKVTRMGVIHTIITNIFTEPTGPLDAGFIYGKPDSVQYITPGRFGVLIIDNTARLLGPGEGVSEDEVPVKYGPNISWYKLLDLYGKFRSGVTRIHLKKADSTEVVGTMSVHPNDETLVMVNWDPDTFPTNTIIAGRGTIDAIIDPLTYGPEHPVATGLRFLLLEGIGDPINQDGPDEWKSLAGEDFITGPNNIIEWDGTKWVVVFDAASTTDVTYVTNLRTGIQYKWDGEVWTKSFEGEYREGHWRMVL